MKYRCYGMYPGYDEKRIKKSLKKIYQLALAIKPINFYANEILKLAIDKRIISGISIEENKAKDNLLGDMICTVELLENYYYNGILQRFEIENLCF